MKIMEEKVCFVSITIMTVKILLHIFVSCENENCKYGKIRRAGKKLISILKLITLLLLNFSDFCDK